MNTMLLSLILLFFSFNFVPAVAYSCNPTTSCGCSASSTAVTSRIVGGELSSNHAWGWMISLKMDGIHRCGASLLTPEYAITAAHCVNGYTDELSLFSILAGTNSLNDTNNNNVQQRPVTSITLHPNFDPQNITNDIAIIQFAALETTSEYNLAFICVPYAYEDPFQIDTNLVALGWGHLSYKGTELSNELRQVTIQVVSTTSTACKNTDFSNANAQFCAGVVAGGKDTCQGDSGGPLMAFVNNQWVLAGITSLGKVCADPGVIGVYTRVSSFISFIASNINSTTLQTIQFETTTKPNSSESNSKINIKLMLLFSFLLFLYS